MIARYLLGIFLSLFFISPSFALITPTGFSELFDQIDKLTCEQSEAILRKNAKIAVPESELIDTTYLRRIVETYALLSRCALNRPTRAEFYEGLLAGLVSSLKDPHSNYLNEKQTQKESAEGSGELFNIGVSLSTEKQQDGAKVIRIVETTPNEPAEKSGLKINDLIVKINERLVSSYQNPEDALDDIKGPRGSRVRLEILRNNDALPIVFTVTREIKSQFVKTTVLPNKWFLAKIFVFEGAYVKGTKILELCAEIESAYTKARVSDPKIKGFVLDLRDNPGGYLDGAQCVFNLFANKSLRGKDLVSVLERDGLKYHPERIDPHDILGGKPLVVLVNGHSASASEIVAKAIQYYDLGVVVGTTTYGKGSIQIIQPLSDEKTAVRYTYAQYFVGPPSAPIIVQGVGVTPNILARSKNKAKEVDTDRESDLDGALQTSTVGKELVIKNTKLLNPDLYKEILRVIAEEPFEMEAVESDK